ncbi:Induced myeloid leukemia cell differentiation protein [Triplophysa tibetana]|uniref:Induced myeloid leukemia cell differentiation protein n=1 Tax=Triplophysa tibetana TaxID=1572043 RepID=A0A5A9N040_9TELE|nr:Induced myeloid leukemia cell differentiation protein [Triplophysa tibetana]
MDSGSKVSNNGGFWPYIGISAFNTDNGFRKSLSIPPSNQNQNQLSGLDLQGSVPSTPDSDCDQIDIYTSSKASLDMNTRENIDSFLKQFAGLSHSRCAKKQVVSTMKRVVDSLVAKHEKAYNGMISRINLEQTDDLSVVTIVATELFSDGITNWGRIASLLAFGAVLCKHLNDSGRSECVSLVGEKISDYLLSDQMDWLLKNNAWDGFVDFFHVPDTEAAVRNALMAIGSVATFGAALAYWIR